MLEGAVNAFDICANEKMRPRLFIFISATPSDTVFIKPVLKLCKQHRRAFTVDAKRESIGSAVRPAEKIRKALKTENAVVIAEYAARFALSFLLARARILGNINPFAMGLVGKKHYPLLVGVVTSITDDMDADGSGKPGASICPLDECVVNVIGTSLSSKRLVDFPEYQ